MAERLSHPDADEDIGAGPDRATMAGASRWQKVVGILGLVVVLWVGSEMYDVVFFDGFNPGPGGDTPVVNQGPVGGSHTGPPAGGH